MTKQNTTSTRCQRTQRRPARARSSGCPSWAAAPATPVCSRCAPSSCSARPRSSSPRCPTTRPSCVASSACPPRRTTRTGQEVEHLGPLFVDGGFGEDGQPLTHASRAKVVVKQAKTGKRVVRLMAGDPFLYASGPEEALACTKAERRLRDRPRRLLGHRRPGVRRHPADHQEPPRGGRGDLQRRQDRLGGVRHPPDAGAALGRRRDRRDRRRAGRRRPQRRHLGLDDPHGHADHPGDDRLHAGRDRRRRPRRRHDAARRSPWSARSSTCARRCRGSRPSRCSAGACWCPAPRSRPARCPRGCAATARRPRRCRRSRSSRPATRSRWTRPSAAWSRAATSGSRSPRSTPCARCARSSRSTASTPVPSPA